MPDPTKITTLRKLNGEILGEWIDSTGCFNVFPDAYGLIADWAEVDLEAVNYGEDELGEGFFIQGELVAALDVTFRKAESAQPAFCPSLPLPGCRPVRPRMVIPNYRVAYIEARVSQVESMVNAMWADRRSLDIQGQNAADIEHHIKRLEYVAGTLRDLLTAKQQPTVLALALAAE